MSRAVCRHSSVWLACKLALPTCSVFIAQDTSELRVKHSLAYALWPQVARFVCAAMCCNCTSLCLQLQPVLFTCNQKQIRINFNRFQYTTWKFGRRIKPVCDLIYFSKTIRYKLLWLTELIDMWNSPLIRESFASFGKNNEQDTTAYRIVIFVLSHVNSSIVVTYIQQKLNRLQLKLYCRTYRTHSAISCDTQIDPVFGIWIGKIIKREEDIEEKNCQSKTSFDCVLLFKFLRRNNEQGVLSMLWCSPLHICVQIAFEWWIAAEVQL